MSFLSGGVGYVVPFLVVLTVLVFVHELGHYLVARWNKVRIETFSIGFGPELFGWTDRVGTRWKVSAIPLGGYVKMFGDANSASMGVPEEEIAQMTEAEKAVSFHHKRLMQRVAVVAAGPAANFIFAIVVFAAVFATVGEAITTPVIGQIQPNSVAAASGFASGDIIAQIDGRRIATFDDIVTAVRLNIGTPMTFVVKRDGAEKTLTATPRVTQVTDRFGFEHRYPVLGIVGRAGAHVRLSPPVAVLHAVEQTNTIASTNLIAVWQMIIGARPADDVHGPLGIALLSGEVAKAGLLNLIGLMAGLSISLGLINLFPIPVLDGGHLLFYAAEALRGRPLGPRAQEYGFRMGLAVVLTLMVFATWNDVAQIGPRVIAFIKGFAT
ncbi:MAG: RIP metalloprotease RseP [Alphaproteobacteria bacterium]|nr:RIP metalloprotease RseP [Alphaproteobacteria bacterium]MDE2513903.1 RIP metalloprotease RseP [Alphaproteobacteria bacterium]